MRPAVDIAKLHRFMAALGQAARSAGCVYLTGGATALLHGWRGTTVDVDLKADPEPAGLFEAIAKLKETLELNVELAAPDQFIPEVPGWRERSPLIARHGTVDFRHYDFYSQALAKLQRGHERDHVDVEAMVATGLVQPARLRELFAAIEPALIRHPGISPTDFRAAVERFGERHSA